MNPNDMNSYDQVRRPRPKSTIFEGFRHRRQASTDTHSFQSPFDAPVSPIHPKIMAFENYSNPGALAELQHNQQGSAPRLPPQQQDRGRSQQRGQGIQVSRAFPTKPKRPKSASNLAGLLKPKTLRNLGRFNSEDDVSSSKDKENRTPEEPAAVPAQTPIYSQFASRPLIEQTQSSRRSMDEPRPPTAYEHYSSSRAAVKERPKSYHPMLGKMEPPPSPTKPRTSNDSRKGSKDSTEAQSRSGRGKVLSVFTTFSHKRSKSTSTVPEPTTPALDPKDIDKHLEAMLDRRNIPENQRYKMRNLSDTIKMEFIRQDWAESHGSRTDRPCSTDSANSGLILETGSQNDDKQKRSRGKSFNLSRGRKEAKEPGSPIKKSKGEGTLGRHFRSKSTDSVVSEAPSTGSISNSGILSKIKLSQGPSDYVAYLRKVQKPQLVEVGKVHKLRLLLRNETVAWIEDFIQQGGMKEIVDLLNRIMEVEWREEHEDALLHEVLLCLKALSTTARAMQYLDSIQADLFPKLLHMLFDPEKKGPSEFTTRNIVTSVLFTYIESASPVDRVARAQSILAHLRDPEPKEDQRPLPFVLEMRQERPYRVWNKEVVSVTKEVFWIFLHNVNVLHASAFPQERPPVPAAPYVGGVEWDATNYLASHLDLMNAILACTPTIEERNSLRAQFRISGWERCMGGSMRLCKEKFYGSVHDGLRTWVGAAVEDGWGVKDVRYGPPPDARTSPKKAGGGQKKPVEAAPKIEMPRLDFRLDKASTPSKDKDVWLS
ncbi:GTPase-binding protein rid1 [Fusarium culmorum]|uniref:GTPase-binding protein rid1 n=1 Tax=Fusarium culmorum TaxID=5516 RepID=A0A2T4GDP9_FUSCU|nr:GTPase-binding protein rid1 [Fusarium culmorum]